MAEYIEREALVHHFMTKRQYLTKDLVMDAAYEVSKFPAADVAPVVHGRWDRTNRLGEFGRYNAHCSNCGYEVSACGWSWEWKTPYCPNCGARMDGE